MGSSGHQERRQQPDCDRQLGITAGAVEVPGAITGSQPNQSIAVPRDRVTWMRFALNRLLLVYSRCPLSRVLRAAPKPLGVISRRVGDGIDRFGARLFIGQMQQRQHSTDGCLVYFLIAGTLIALRAVGQACTTPSRLEVFGRHGWAFGGNGTQ